MYMCPVFFCLGNELQNAVFREDFYQPFNKIKDISSQVAYTDTVRYITVPQEYQHNVNCFRDGDGQGSCLGDEPQHGVFREDLSRSATARMSPSKCHT